MKRPLGEKSEQALLGFIDSTHSLQQLLLKQRDTLQEIVDHVVRELMFRKGVMKMNEDGHAVIEWSSKTLTQFCQRYVGAVKEGDEQFVFQEHEFLTSYAKYLIQYLEMEFTRRGDLYSHSGIGLVGALRRVRDVEGRKA